VVAKSNVWKAEREELIAKSKVVVNIHYFEHSILESVRLSYLLSNQCEVISEVSLDPILDRWHSGYLSLVAYDQLVEKCCEFIADYPHNLNHQKFEEYQKQTFVSKLPLANLIKSYEYLITMIDDKEEAETEAEMEAETELELEPDVTDDSDLFQCEYEINENKEIILKLPKFTYDQLPFVSIVTPTFNRKDIFPLAIRNWELFDYPREKMEWIIVDDSDDPSQNLSDILPKSKQIKYFKLQTTGRLSIGQKRNFGVKQAQYDYIAHLDDDDYFCPFSLRSRLGILSKYFWCDLVGVTELDIYDIKNDFSARIKGCAQVSESSMAFRKSFWEERPFPEKFNSLGEGHLFTKGRRDRIIKMPSCFNLIALTHWSNYTTERSQSKFQHVERKGNILSTLDLSTRLFLYSLFDKIKREEEKKKNLLV
jgi:hypothetical protein